MKLECRNINKSFGEKQVLHDLNFTVESGKAAGLLGRNGAGKTTTIRIIMDFFKADSGEVLFDGTDISKLGIKIGYLPAERGLYPKKKIGEQMIYFAVLRGMDKKSAEKSVREWLERVELPEYFDKKLDTLSKGNQQKIQLALALINDPDIVILDEPFSGLDPVNSLMLKNIITEFKSRDKIALFSSHQMSYVEEFCDDIIILHHGKIALGGNLRKIKRGYPRDKIEIIPDDSSIEDCIKLLKSGEMSAIVKSIESKNEIINIVLTSPDKKDELLKILIDNKINLSSYMVIEPSLEEIFISVAETEAE